MIQEARGSVEVTLTELPSVEKTLEYLAQIPQYEEGDIAKQQLKASIRLGFSIKVQVSV